MNKTVKTVLQVALFALFIAAAIWAYGAISKNVAPDGAAGLNGGDRQEPEKTDAPDFTVFDAVGEPVKLSEMRGKPVVLNFWASWCSPCRGEMPEFERLYQESGGEIVFMMVDLVDGRRETKAKGARYIEEQGFTFPVYFDTEQDAAIRYGVSSIPRTIFIDREGKIITAATGSMDGRTLQKGIELIEQQQPFGD